MSYGTNSHYGDKSFQRTFHSFHGLFDESVQWGVVLAPQALGSVEHEGHD